MEEKSQQVEGDHEIGQVLLPMPEVMFKMIALSFQNVVGFVFTLPACPTIPNDGDNIAALQFVMGDKGIVIDLLVLSSRVIVTSHQLTIKASSLRRKGTPLTQRYCWIS